MHAALTSLPNGVSLSCKTKATTNGAKELPLPAPATKDSDERMMILELEDGTIYQGYSFGAPVSIAGELVFQTGMVGYPESMTDPSYRGQILVVTFPLAGNYGVPSRDATDNLLTGLPAYFESAEIHVAGLVIASYSGEDYSHHLATSSLGTWLKEQGVPAVHGVDTRALTKKIREQGSMLGKMLIKLDSIENVSANGSQARQELSEAVRSENWRTAYESVTLSDPNMKNLVADGEVFLWHFSNWLTFHVDLSLLS